MSTVATASTIPVTNAAKQKNTTRSCRILIIAASPAPTLAAGPSGMDNLTFFPSWRIVTKVLDKYETVCSFPSYNENKRSVGRTT
jgi:hypothetical protein